MHPQTEAVTMWFDRRLAMRKSPIHGVGVFATDPISAGERLMFVTGGIVYTSEDWRTGRVVLDGEQYNEGQIGPDLFVATPKTLHYYVNHSCNPAMLNDLAWRDIQAGEEITLDYAYCESNPKFRLDPCLCGSPLCRGKVTGDDWRIPALQQRYHGSFTPYVAGLIANLNRAGDSHAAP
jgi:SET domain-containing protein